MISFNLFYESQASDLYEKAVADYLRKLGVTVISTTHDTSYSDVKVEYNGNVSWIEVKMGHKDNLANPRFFFDGEKWDTTYATPIAAYAVNILNTDSQAKKFVNDLKKFTGKKNITIPTTRSGLRDPNAVSLEKMVEFVEQRPQKRYILKHDDVNVSELVIQHYLKGKVEPAHYLQAGDDFYRLSKQNPLKLPQSIPLFNGNGTFNIRVSTRSEFYEVQLEAKVTHMENSPYSVKPGTKKLNPFD